ncbi:MAG TPA: SIS domain-containing protein [Candidatus Hydrogenedentes bacterium]|nr:SIS domain-containing protein [Candidatus Hydrogenedentota bacterium]
MHYLANLFQQSSEFEAYAKGYFQRVNELARKLDLDAVRWAMEHIGNTRQNGNALYFFANGGSAAVAAHWVNDLMAGANEPGKPAFRAYCLSDNTSTVTAIGNDSAFENIFRDQLRAYIRPGDVALAMSVSGNSENIIRGLQAARDAGATTIGIAGMSGGRMSALCDVFILIPTTADEYGPVEDLFSLLEHLITGWLTMSAGKWMHHG